jgi:hypothetical protein
LLCFSELILRIFYPKMSSRATTISSPLTQTIPKPPIDSSKTVFKKPLGFSSW